MTWLKCYGLLWRSKAEMLLKEELCTSAHQYTIKQLRKRFMTRLECYGVLWRSKAKILLKEETCASAHQYTITQLRRRLTGLECYVLP